MPQGDGNPSRYNGRDRWLGLLRWEVGRVREYITEECCPVALANKTARIAWAVMHRHENYQCVAVAA